MARMRARVTYDSALLGRKLTERCNKLVTADRTLRSTAADTATTVTRAHFKPKRPGGVPARAGRAASGQMLAGLRWVTKPTTGMVAFDTAEADSKAPFWIIQEIGTGQSATLRQGGSANPVGRPAVGATYVRTVPTQIGRAIPRSLVWATGPGGTYSPAGAGSGQQLYLRAKVKGAPQGPGRSTFIGREIHGQHFVQRGGTEAFREYRSSVLAAARRAFAGQARP